VAPGDADGLRACLRQLLDDPARRARLVAAGRARAEEFSLGRIAGRFVDLYELAIARSPMTQSAAGRAV
jgi:glycosyltransferase involved in cell wall biosynthesis